MCANRAPRLARQNALVPIETPPGECTAPAGLLSMSTARCDPHFTRSGVGGGPIHSLTCNGIPFVRTHPFGRSRSGGTCSRSIAREHDVRINVYIWQCLVGSGFAVWLPVISGRRSLGGAADMYAVLLCERVGRRARQSSYSSWRRRNGWHRDARTRRTRFTQSIIKW